MKYTLTYAADTADEIAAALYRIQGSPAPAPSAETPEKNKGGRPAKAKESVLPEGQAMPSYLKKDTVANKPAEKPASPAELKDPRKDPAYPQVQKATQDIVKIVGREAAVSLLAKYGAGNNAVNIKREDWDTYVEEATAIIEAAQGKKKDSEEELA